MSYQGHKPEQYHLLYRDDKGLYVPIKILGLTVKKKRFSNKEMERIRKEQPHTGLFDPRTIEDRFPTFWDEDKEGLLANAYEVKPTQPDMSGLIQFYHVASLSN